MINTILAFARAWWKPLLILIVVGSVWLYHNHLTGTIDQQRNEIAQLTSANQVLEGNNARLLASIDANNTAIAKLAQTADATNKNFASLGSSVKSQTATMETRLRAILAERKPLTCEDTIQYLIDAVGEYPK